MRIRGHAAALAQTPRPRAPPTGKSSRANETLGKSTQMPAAHDASFRPHPVSCDIADIGPGDADIPQRPVIHDLQFGDGPAPCVSFTDVRQQPNRRRDDRDAPACARARHRPGSSCAFFCRSDVCLWAGRNHVQRGSGRGSDRCRRLVWSCFAGLFGIRSLGYPVHRQGVGGAPVKKLREYPRSDEPKDVAGRVSKLSGGPEEGSRCRGGWHDGKPL
jgi:hypothetical protein